MARIVHSICIIVLLMPSLLIGSFAINDHDETIMARMLETRYGDENSSEVVYSVEQMTNLSIAIETNPLEIREGVNLNISVQIRNIGPETVMLGWPSHSNYRGTEHPNFNWIWYLIESPEGVVFERPGPDGAGASVSIVTFLPDQTHYFNYTWNPSSQNSLWQMPAGEYVLKIMTLGPPNGDAVLLAQTNISSEAGFLTSAGYGIVYIVSIPCAVAIAIVSSRTIIGRLNHGYDYRMGGRRRGIMAITGGILVVSGSCIGILGSYFGAWFNPYISDDLLINLSGYIGLILFSLSLIGGALAILRKIWTASLAFSIVGAAACSLLAIGSWEGEFFAIPAFMLAIIGMEFIAFSRNAFAKKIDLEVDE